MKTIWEKALLESQYSSADVFPQVQTQQPAKEEYDAFIERDKLYIKASSVSTLTTAFAQISIAKRASLEHNFQGRVSPKFQKRPLWILGEETLYLNGYPIVTLPKAALDNPQQYAKDLSYALLEAGYNTLVLGDPWLTTGNRLGKDTAHIFLQELKSYGFELYLFINPCVEEKDSFDSFQQKAKEHYRILEEEMPMIDGFMTRSVSDIEFAEPLIYPERVRLQMETIEALIGSKRLIYYFDFKSHHEASQCARWIEEILDATSGNTTVSFSYYIGDMRGQSFTPNPIWNALEKTWESSSTPIFPLMNIGGVDCGEGLWPNGPITLFNELEQQASDHSYSGIIPFTRFFPLKRGLLRGYIWSFGASQWQGQSPADLLKVYLAAYYSSKKLRQVIHLLKDAEEISHLMQKIQSCSKKEAHELAVYIKYLLAKANLLDFSSRALSEGYITQMIKFFVRDVKKRLLLWNQQWKLHVNEIASGDDLKESFWVSVEHSIRGGLGSGAKGEILIDPYLPDSQPIMKEIFDINR